jgi:signal transduction histidine kinase
MSTWWQKRSRRVWLALGYALAGDAVFAVCAVILFQLRMWKPAEIPDSASLPDWVGAGMAVTLLLLFIGYVLAGLALEPVRETIELARRFSSQPGGKQIAVTNPHDELGELETFLNALLQRLEGSFVELDRLAADVSHELRTPLTAMRSVGEVALRERNPAILYDAVGSILEEVRRMNQLIDRLLLLTRSDSDKWPVRPKAGLVRSVLLEVSETLGMVAADKQQLLQIDCAEDLRATFDPALLRLALINLTQNALRYSPPGRPVYLHALVEGQRVVVEVAEEGPGIAPEHQHKIFQRFYRVDAARSRAEGGVGLGLAIVKWAVERTGGTVALESELGRGSVFRVHLPRALP